MKEKFQSSHSFLKKVSIGGFIWIIKTDREQKALFTSKRTLFIIFPGFFLSSRPLSLDINKVFLFFFIFDLLLHTARTSYWYWRFHKAISLKQTRKELLPPFFITILEEKYFSRIVYQAIKKKMPIFSLPSMSGRVLEKETVNMVRNLYHNKW